MKNCLCLIYLFLLLKFLFLIFLSRIFYFPSLEFFFSFKKKKYLNPVDQFSLAQKNYNGALSNKTLTNLSPITPLTPNNSSQILMICPNKHLTGPVQ